MSKPSYSQLIEEHYTEAWSAPLDSVRLTQGPIAELPDCFGVLAIRRTPEMIAYATKCMSQLIDSERIELHVLARADREASAGIIEILTAVAHYHRTCAPLGLGHTVNFGKPWLPGSACAHGLISLPYLDGPSLEWLKEPAVRFLWVVPITESELQFKKTYGQEALEVRLEESEFDYLDPLRSSVV